MNTDIVTGILIGLPVGVGLTNAWHLYGDLIRSALMGKVAPRPLRLERMAPSTVFINSVDASIEAEHIPNMWRSRMRAFLFHAEMCRTPCNARDLQARTGLTRPKQWEYIDILVRANLIEIPARGKAIWKTDWHTRRKTLSAYPYPRNYEPPNFRALGVITDGTDRTQNRQE